MSASPSPQSSDPQSPHYVRPFRASLLAMMGIALVNILVALDQTVVSTSLPSIISDLSGFQYYAWMASAYLLASLVTVPIFGRLGDFFGRKPFVIAAITTFTLASVLCGLAPTMLTLILARGLQGVGGGMMIGTAMASIPDLFPDPHSRVRWQVVLAASYGIGTAAGPSIGGFLSEHYGWRSTFMVNLPIGIAALLMVMRYLPRFRVTAPDHIKLDWLGAVLIAATLGGLQMVVENVPKDGLTLFNLALLVGVLVAGAALLLVERHAAHPIVPLELFRHADLRVLFALSFLAGSAMFSLIFFTPLLLQGGFGLSPQQSGLLATPLPVCIALGSVVNTRIVMQLKRPTTVLTLGYALLLLACIGVVATHSYTPLALLVVAMGAGGFGLGFILNNLNIFGQEIAGRALTGITTALMQSTRMVGGMLGTAAVGIVIERGYASGLARILDRMVGNQQQQQWIARFGDPQVLIDAASRKALLTDFARVSSDGPKIVELGGQVLVGAVHTGVLITAVLMVAAVLLVRNIPNLQLHHTRPEDFISGE